MKWRCLACAQSLEQTARQISELMLASIAPVALRSPLVRVAFGSVTREALRLCRRYGFFFYLTLSSQFYALAEVTYYTI